MKKVILSEVDITEIKKTIKDSEWEISVFERPQAENSIKMLNWLKTIIETMLETTNGN